MEIKEFLRSTHWKIKHEQQNTHKHIGPYQTIPDPIFTAFFLSIPDPVLDKHQVLPLAFSFWVSASAASPNSVASVPCDASWRCSNTGEAQNGEVEIEIEMFESLVIHVIQLVDNNDVNTQFHEQWIKVRPFASFCILFKPLWLSIQ